MSSRLTALQLLPQVAEHEADQRLGLLAPLVGLAPGPLRPHREPRDHGQHRQQEHERPRHRRQAQPLPALALRLVEQPAQAVRRLLRRGAAPRIEALEVHDQPGEVGVEPLDRPGPRQRHLAQQLGLGQGLVGRQAGDELVQEDAERVEIARRRDLAVGGLLRAHGVECAHHHALPGQPGQLGQPRRRIHGGGRGAPALEVGGVQLVRLVVALRRKGIGERRRRDHLEPVGHLGHLGPLRRRIGERAGDPEVEHLHLALGSHHDVVRLEIAVDDLLAMGGGEGRGDLRGELELAFERDLPAAPPACAASPPARTPGSGSPPRASRSGRRPGRSPDGRSSTAAAPRAGSGP